MAGELESRLHRLLHKAAELGGRLVLELEEDGDVYAGLLDPDGVELAAGRGPGVDEATAGLGFRLGEGRTVELDELRAWLVAIEAAGCPWSPRAECWAGLGGWPVRRWGHGPCAGVSLAAAGAANGGLVCTGAGGPCRVYKKQKRRKRRR